MKYYSIFSSIVFVLLLATKVDVSAHQENGVAEQPNHRHRHLRAIARNIPQASPTTADPASSSLIMVSANAGDIRDYDHCVSKCQDDLYVTCLKACGENADCETGCDLNPFAECDSFCTKAATDAERLPLAATTKMIIGVEEQDVDDVEEQDDDDVEEKDDDDFLLNFCRFWFSDCHVGGPLPVLDETTDDETEDDAFDRMFIQCKQLLPNCNPPSSLEEEVQKKLNNVEFVSHLLPDNRYNPVYNPAAYGNRNGAVLPPAANPDSPPGVNPYDNRRQDPFEDSHQSSGAGLPPAANPDSPPGVRPYYDNHRQDPAYNPPGVHSDYELPMGGGESAVIIE